MKLILFTISLIITSTGTAGVGGIGGGSSSNDLNYLSATARSQLDDIVRTGDIIHFQAVGSVQR